MKYLLRNSIIFIWMQYFFFYEIMVYYLRFFKELQKPYSVRLEAYIGLILIAFLLLLFLYKMVTEKKLLVRVVYFLAIIYSTIALMSMVYFVSNGKYSFVLESIGIAVYALLVILTFFADKQIYKEANLYRSILILFGIVFICWIVVIFMEGVIY